MNHAAPLMPSCPPFQGLLLNKRQSEGEGAEGAEASPGAGWLTPLWEARTGSG